jgi:adenosylcobinamide hydrolase
VDLELLHRDEDGEELPVAVLRFGRPLRTISSSPLGGGIGERRWVLNAQVHRDYARTDPDAHLAGLARRFDLDGEGVGMLTAARVRSLQRAEDGGVEVAATVGLGLPTWAAAPDVHAGQRAGTINIVAVVPARLSDAALVNAVATATEAKAQALWEAGVAATGTASDAVCVVAATGGRVEAFGGPRSVWGARLARAVHAAVLEGAR